MEQDFNSCLLKIKPLVDYSKLDTFGSTPNNYYVYFEMEEIFYIFLFNDGSTDLNPELLEQLEILEHVQKKGKRKIKSLRGFLEKMLEYMHDKGLVTHKTNLHPLFWGKIQDIIRARQKNGIGDYVFIKIERPEEKSHLRFKELLERIEKLETRIGKLETLVIEQTAQEETRASRSKEITPSESSKIREPSKKAFRENFKVLGDIGLLERTEIAKLAFEQKRDRNNNLKTFFEVPHQGLFEIKGYCTTYERFRRCAEYRAVAEEFKKK